MAYAAAHDEHALIDRLEALRLRDQPKTSA